MTQTVTARTEGTSPRRPSALQPCNFRYAGRLSNENARLLTTLHERLALHVANSLEVYLGSAVQMRFVSLEQTVSSEFVVRERSESLLVPCALGVLEASILIEMEAVAVLPLIDLLLGGNGVVAEETRELTEIDEDIMDPVASLLVTEIERGWKAVTLSLKAGRCIKPAAISQVFPMTEKLVLLCFEITVASVSAGMKIIVPTSFVGYLLRHLRAAQSKKTSSLRALYNPTLRERLLDSTFSVAAEQTEIRLPVRDLVDLRVGAILRMQAPVKRPGRLTVEGIDIFEAAVVRHGQRKAAQLLLRSQEPAAVRD